VSTIASGHYVGLGMSKKRRLRRLWADEEKIQIVAQTRVSGVSVSQVARRYDVNANLVFRWLRDPRFNRLVEDHTAVSFLPVEVVAEPPTLDSPVINAPVVDTPAIEVGATESKIEIVLPTGHRISVSGAYDPEALCRLVRGLSS
jgi:transposase